MSILSDKVIEELTEWWLHAPEDVDWAQTILKAQDQHTRKEIKEWGEELCKEHAPEKYYNSVHKRFQCSGCWQSLLSEEA